MTRSEMAALLNPYANLDERCLASTENYLNLLLKWNARINLTAVRRPEEIVGRHFGESFFAAAYLLNTDDSLSAIDLGSGAGFPGLPIALFASRVRMTLIEASGKKAAFLNEAVRALGLDNVKVFTGRAEAFQGTADLVTMRAVEKFDVALSRAHALVNPGGRLALMIGASQVEAAEKQIPRLIWQAPVEVPGGHSRVLLVGKKE